jgi:hypothetical protein
MSRLGVSGPSASACADQGLNAGIRVVGGATLDLSHARVTDIVNTPADGCDHHGNAISVGDLDAGEVGHAVIRDVEVSHYSGSAVVVFNPGSTITVTGSALDARIQPAEHAFTGGVEVGNGASAHVTHNVIRGNRCASPDIPCGSDPINEFQASAIGNGPGAAPAADSEFAHNHIVGNDVGVYVFAWDNCCRIHDNRIVDSLVSGVTIQDGSAEIGRNVIRGGPVGVAVVADAVDTVGTLRHVTIRGTSEAETKTIQCCGFTATVIRR